MDANNWPNAQGGEAAVDDWRATLQPDRRQRIVNEITETLKRHLPFAGQEGLEELKNIAVQFEEKIYTAAASQSEYLRKISLKMLTMESKSSPSNIPNSLASNPSGNNNRPPDTAASQSLQPQVHNQGQLLPVPLPANQSQTRQHLLSQNIQYSMVSTGVQSSAGLTSALLPVSGLTQAPIPTQTGHVNGGDWQEEVYQKIQAMNEMYLPELNEMHEKICMKLQQHDSVPQQPKSDQLEKLQLFKVMLERIIAFLNVSENNISLLFKEKLGFYEEQIMNFLSASRPREAIPPMQQ